MSLKQSRTLRQSLVTVNYGSVLLLLSFFHTAQFFPANPFLLAGLVLSLITVMATFFLLHIKTGLWRLVHTHQDSLDEREIQVTHQALRLSYSWFSVIVLVLFYVELLVIKSTVTALDIACLIYLAHTLPASLIAWREAEI